MTPQKKKDPLDITCDKSEGMLTDLAMRKGVGLKCVGRFHNGKGYSWQIIRDGVTEPSVYEATGLRNYLWSLRRNR